MLHPRLIALLLALATLLIFLPVTRCDFLHYDDQDYVTANRMVQNGLTLDGVKWAFTTFHACNWHPLTWLSHMADCQFFGLAAGAHHFVNALIHSVNAALLFFLLWRWTNKMWPSALVAALFAWHPLRVESVAWIAERKDVLCAFFWLLTLICYTERAASPNRLRRTGFYWLTLFCFALALMSKPMAVTLPFAMLLLDYWPLKRFAVSRRTIFQLVAEKIPFLLMTAVICALTVFAQQGAISPFVPVSLRVENATAAYARYLMKLFWPSNLAVLYPFEKTSGTTFMASLVPLIFISAAVWFIRKRQPWCLMGWLWFLGTLIPVVGLMQVGSAAIADRYTYIPSIGIFMAVVFGVADITGNNARNLKIFSAGAGLALIACVLGTEKQLTYWRDGETLFRHAIAVTSKNYIAYCNLSAALEQKGDDAEALQEYRETLQLNPQSSEAHFGMGNILEKMNKPAEALAEYRECIRLDPQVPAFHAAAGCALATLQEWDDALKEFAQALELDPHYTLPRLEMAKIHFKQGHDQEAANEMLAAAQDAPNDFQVLATAAHYFAAIQNPAIRDGRRNQPMVLDIVGMAYAENGDFSNAISFAQSALNAAAEANLPDTNAITQRLLLYQNHQPWRESFQLTNGPAHPLPQ